MTCENSPSSQASVAESLAVNSSDGKRTNDQEETPTHERISMTHYKKFREAG